LIYQLRTYWAAPGKREALHERFRSLTLRIFARHDMRMIGFWVPDPLTEESGDLIYLLSFLSHSAMDAAWAAMRADPEWQQGKAASEADGVLVAKIDNRVLLPTDYSPLP
jgi:NIPSNAP protein